MADRGNTRSAARCLGLLMMGVCLAGTSGISLAQTTGSNRLAVVQRTHELRVCAWSRPGGVMYRDPRTGAMTGMDAELANELARDLDAKLVFVDTDWEDTIEQVEHERCDLAMGGIAITPDRVARMRFTKPYLQSDVYAIVSAFTSIKSWSDVDRPEVIVGALIGSALESTARRRLHKARIVGLRAPYWPEGELAAGRIDAYLANFAMARYAGQHAHGVRVLAPDQPFEINSYGYAAKPGDDGWVARLDAFVAAIKRDGRLERAAKRWGYEDLILRN